MNKIKKAAFGVLVAGLAFGFSAFTTIKKSSVFTYYQVNNPYAAPSNPNGYAYYSGDRCEAGGNLCTAQWDIGLNPPPFFEGQALPPTGVTLQTSTITSGHFE
ncbi:MAG: hypothetical protein P0Y49_17620 [Candidatus Pedobacter colombiensis]|uniref:Uncharacterized protein n=1 Tax=Candidatus Pedobacter colombiensis TaxID=3121371 RepID=A0AAJ5W7Q4_9SPHI|nr:hypothetical protein [Pedobacter sp.]WEK18610.1 MAG: hypothetical protein P0Y49_17620 [Pedobacter sp.]